MDESKAIQDAKMRLIETGGRASQDLGTGRIVGQVLVYLYLQENECSLDTIGEELGLSKASVSIAVRQLEQLGLARKVWKSGDKRNYYKSADNIAKALQQGLISFVRQKIQIFGDELESSMECLDAISGDSPAMKEAAFLRKRISRAQDLKNGLDRILGNPLVKFLTGIKYKENEK